MFTSLKFGEKNDKLVDNIKKIQEQGEVRRRALQVTCEEFGVVNKSKLPIEDHADFDARVKELSEDIEQLDEISKKVLGNYLKAATDDVMDRSTNWGAGKTHDEKGKRNLSKILRRRAHMQRATDRLTKEEVELSEISKKVLGRYVTRAGHDMADNKAAQTKFATYAGMQNSAKDELKYIDHSLDHGRKAGKRAKGIQKAVDRLTKEEVDPIVEAVVSKYIVESIIRRDG